MVTVGLIGFALAMIALVIEPFFSFWRERPTDLNFGAMLFALFSFIALHNFMESDFIEVTAVQWGQMLLVIALLRSLSSTKPYRPAW